MAGFEPITSPEQLPDEGTSVETLARDFKRLVPAGALDRAELAKDVAAFANRIGGVLLIGAVEDKKRGTLGRYNPADEVTANEMRRACSEAVRDFCSPQPVFDAERVPKDGGFVVAVNVWPFPGQAIGVRRTGDAHAYTFPLRTGTDCTFLRPEQLPMLMIPELRRIVALLYGIPAGKDVFVQQPSGPRMKFRFLEADEVRNVVVLTYTDGQSANRPFNIPLDSIVSVWCNEAGLWELQRK